MTSAEMGRAIAEMLRRPTISVDQAALVLGICRNSAYAAAARGEIPTIRIGRLLKVPTSALRAKLGIEND